MEEFKRILGEVLCKKLHIVEQQWVNPTSVADAWIRWRLGEEWYESWTTILAPNTEIEWEVFFSMFSPEKKKIVEKMWQALLEPDPSSLYGALRSAKSWQIPDDAVLRQYFKPAILAHIEEYQSGHDYPYRSSGLLELMTYFFPHHVKAMRDPEICLLSHDGWTQPHFHIAMDCTRTISTVIRNRVISQLIVPDSFFKQMYPGIHGDTPRKFSNPVEQLLAFFYQNQEGDLSPEAFERYRERKGETQSEQWRLG